MATALNVTTILPVAGIFDQAYCGRSLAWSFTGVVNLDSCAGEKRLTLYVVS